MRADHVAGYTDANTLALRTIAEEGAVFEDFYAASTYTLPSHMSMLTGLSPIEHGVVNYMSKLGPDVPTLATQLAAAGYRTQAFQEGGYVGERFGFDRGFVEYAEKAPKQVVIISLWSVLDWIREAGDEPYFLFLHTYSAHSPYGGFETYRAEHPELGLPSDGEILELRSEYQRKTYRTYFPASRDIPLETRRMCTLYNALADSVGDQLGCGDRHLLEEFIEGPNFESHLGAIVAGYDNGILRADRAIAKIRELLIDLGQWEDTLFIVTSDHGDGFFEHELFGHDYLPFNEVLKVPLILSYPRRIPGGRVLEGLTWHLDLAPTILSLAQTPVPDGLQGRDLTPALLGREALPEDRVIYPVLLRVVLRAHMPMRRMALRGNLKYIEGHEAYGDSEGLLFDLGADPEEIRNLRNARPEEVAEFEALIESHVKGLEPGSPVHQKTGASVSPFPGDVEPVEIDEEDKEKMRALGYLF